MRVVGPGRYLLLHLLAPVLLVAGGVLLLLLAAVDQVMPFLPREAAFTLFGTGLAAWFAGVAFGVLVNGERLVVADG